MGLDTKIYCNHSLSIPDDSKSVIELLLSLWHDKAVLVDSIDIDIDEEKLVSDPKNFKVLISAKLIEFEYPKFQEIRINTNFKFSGYIRIYPKTIQLTPVGIGRNATNMIVEFMDQPLGIYADDPKRFLERKNDWSSFKLFLNNFISEFGDNKHLYINDGVFEGVSEMAWDGGTVDEMIEASRKLVDPCESKEQFVNKHTWIRDDGIRNINGDVWFIRENR